MVDVCKNGPEKPHHTTAHSELRNSIYIDTVIVIIIISVCHHS